MTWKPDHVKEKIRLDRSMKSEWLKQVWLILNILIDLEEKQLQ
jgi:hypothetical protein